ncbi:hypothetical protein [Novosphingobium sp. ZW T3_23]|uniref:hypothetical protein n=1 Tax=Novosphingobium sp. ZW T3_23 TaxID=3378084 RepID=UPI003851ACDF
MRGTFAARASVIVTSPFTAQGAFTAHRTLTTHGAFAAYGTFVAAENLAAITAPAASGAIVTARARGALVPRGTCIAGQALARAASTFGAFGSAIVAPGSIGAAPTSRA